MPTLILGGMAAAGIALMQVVEVRSRLENSTAYRMDFGWRQVAIPILGQRP